MSSNVWRTVVILAVVGLILWGARPAVVTLASNPSLSPSHSTYLSDGAGPFLFRPKVQSLVFVSKIIEGGEVALVTPISILRDLVLKRTTQRGRQWWWQLSPSHQPITTRLRYVGILWTIDQGTDLVGRMSEYNEARSIGTYLLAFINIFRSIWNLLSRIGQGSVGRAR